MEKNQDFSMLDSDNSSRFLTFFSFFFFTCDDEEIESMWCVCVCVCVCVRERERERERETRILGPPKITQNRFPSVLSLSPFLSVFLLSLPHFIFFCHNILISVSILFSFSPSHNKNTSQLAFSVDPLFHPLSPFSRSNSCWAENQWDRNLIGPDAISSLSYPLSLSLDAHTCTWTKTPFLR